MEIHKNVEGYQGVKRKIVQIRKFNSETGEVTTQLAPPNQYFSWLNQTEENQLVTSEKLDPQINGYNHSFVSKQQEPVSPKQPI